MGYNGKKTRGSRAFTAIAVIVSLLAIGVLLWGGIAPKDRKKMADKVDSFIDNIGQSEIVVPTETKVPETPWNLTLVNRERPIPQGWQVDPVELENGQVVDARIYDPLMQMFEAARSINMDRLPNVESGYRSMEKQQSLYDQKLPEFLNGGYSEEEARALTEKWVSVPGTSEHQLGIAVDISGEVYDIYAWLQENSWKYGFILRYPPDKTSITGVSGEEWHYRYVGVEASTEMHDKELCLEEYLEQYNPK